MPEDHPNIWTLIALLSHVKHADQWDTRARDIRALLDSGADPNDGREPPLLLAARIGHSEIARILLDAGAVEIARMLLEHGADPLHVNRTGKPIAASTIWPRRRREL